MERQQIVRLSGLGVLRRRGMTLVVAGLLIACASTSSSHTDPRPVPPSQEVVEATEAYADRLIESALKEEPNVSPILRTVAQEAGGELWGYEYRFKSKKSLRRKINKILVENPGKIVEDVRINDALRYTVLVDDEPSGTYVLTLQKILTQLEAIKHRVELVKNYWPTGDNYSGVNCVLLAPSGLFWELQFHTRASKKTNSENRAMYEEIRLTTTPIKRKRELYDVMTETWDAVDVPNEVLLDKNLHAKEEIISRDRP